MKSINFAIIYYAAMVCTIVFSLLFLVHLSFPKVVPTPNKAPYQMYKALPNESFSNTQKAEIGKADARPVIIASFLKQHKSPLSPLSEEFVKVADRYELDFRLLPAIAMQESNGGKKLPKNSFNPFGYGIYGDKVLRFASFQEAIDRVGRGLKKDYLDQGLENPNQIMAKYTPPSLQKGGAWALGVSAFMEQLL